MSEMLLDSLILLLIIIYELYGLKLKRQIKELKKYNIKLEDWLNRRDTYIAELQQRLERKRQPVIAVIPPMGQLSFDERHDICYVVPVYKN